MAMRALHRFVCVTMRVFSLTAVVRAWLTESPLTEVSISQWFKGICLLKDWLRTAGVNVAETPSSVTWYSESTGAVALEASNTAISSRAQEKARRARAPAAMMENILFMVVICYLPA